SDLPTWRPVAPLTPNPLTGRQPSNFHQLNGCGYQSVSSERGTCLAQLRTCPGRSSVSCIVQLAHGLTPHPCPLPLRGRESRCTPRYNGSTFQPRTVRCAIEWTRQPSAENASSWLGPPSRSLSPLRGEGRGEG